MAAELTLTDAARALSVSPATLRRWVADGIVPLRDGEWSSAALAQARMVVRLRKRGHGLAELREAARDGRLAVGYLEDLFPSPGRGAHELDEAARETGLEPELIRRIWSAAGFPEASLGHLSDDDLALLRRLAAVLDAGLPLVAFLQLVRVYGQALAHIADAEVKLFHLYVHEPLIRDGVPVLDIAEELADLASELLPLTAPIMDSVHQRLLGHFLEQDVVGHLERAAPDDAGHWRVDVAVAFADLAGYTRLTEEVGEEEALGVVERFVERVATTLPEDARVVKTIGDEVMVVGSDPATIVDWAVGFAALTRERPLPRIGIHAGSALYRDGDYYGSAVNLAARVGARATGGEVLVTREVRHAAGRHRTFQPLGSVKLKGFDEATELFPGAMISLLSGPVLVLLSGGRDSVCLLDLAVRHAGPVRALHVNYGLRAEAGADEAHCAAVCARLGVPLLVARPERAPGNVQAWAREARYAAARRLANGALIATGHTATDQVETVLYRLAASPGRRALLGMAARSGDVIRPLLGMTREETAEYCVQRGLTWREDTSNAASARGRIRELVLPALRSLHPAADANILRTLATLRDEAEVLDAAVSAVLDEAAPPAGGGVDLAGLPPALARLVLQRLADDAAGGQAPALGTHAGAVLALSRHGTVGLDLPGGLRAVSEYGRVSVLAGEAATPAPASLPVPGRVAYGTGELVCERGAFGVADGILAAAELASELEVRPWRHGDRMRPLGLGGSKSLQDLFTDRKVPRARRAQLPVVVSGGEIAWVPGVATGERFRVSDGTGDRVRLSWRLDSAAP